jgi:hypothetical protein
MAEVIENQKEDAPRRGPGRPRKHPIRTAKYHIYQEREDGSLTHLGEAEARNAELAASDFLKSHEEMLGNQPFLVVPNRNISRIHAEVETTKRVRVSTT